MTVTVLVVGDTGTCRAPAAAAALSHRLDTLVGGPDLRIVCRATEPLAGAALDARMVSTMGRRGLALGDDAEPAGQLRRDDVVGADLVLAVDRLRRARSIEICPPAADRTFCLREFAALATVPDLADVHGPEARMAATVRQAHRARGLQPPPRTPEDDTVPPPSRWPLLSHRQTAAVIDDASRRIRDVLAPTLDRDRSDVDAG